MIEFALELIGLAVTGAFVWRHPYARNRVIAVVRGLAGFNTSLYGNRARPVVDAANRAFAQSGLAQLVHEISQQTGAITGIHTARGERLEMPGLQPLCPNGGPGEFERRMTMNLPATLGDREMTDKPDAAKVLDGLRELLNVPAIATDPLSRADKQVDDAIRAIGIKPGDKIELCEFLARKVEEWATACERAVNAQDFRNCKDQAQFHLFLYGLVRGSTVPVDPHQQTETL